MPARRGRGPSGGRTGSQRGRGQAGTCSRSYGCCSPRCDPTSAAGSGSRTQCHDQCLHGMYDHIMRTTQSASNDAMTCINTCTSVCPAHVCTGACAMGGPPAAAHYAFQLRTSVSCARVRGAGAPSPLPLARRDSAWRCQAARPPPTAGDYPRTTTTTSSPPAARCRPRREVSTPSR